MNDMNEILALQTAQSKAFEEFKSRHDAKAAEQAATLREIERRVGRMGPGAGGPIIEGRAFGAILAERIAEHADVLQKSGRLTINIEAKDAPPGPLLSSDVGRRVNLGGLASGGPVIGAQSAFRVSDIMPVTTVDYHRFNGVTGTAGVQTEASAKAQVQPNFTPIAQPTLTIAAWAKLSVQALNDTVELSGVVDGILRRQLQIRLDAVLTGGSGSPWTGLETLADDVTSSTYTSMVDAISEQQSAMQVAGFNPDVVILAPADWLAIVTAKATGGSEEYLSGAYLAQLAMAIRGLRVVISPSLSAGAACLVDSSMLGLVVAGGVTAAVGTVGDDFTSNLRVLLVETRVAPVLRADGAVALVTPKSAT